MKANGRPLLSDNEISTVFQKLEPYLMSGLSIRKACAQAKVPRSTVYCLTARNQGFLDQITRSKQYISVLLCLETSRMLINITERQNQGNELSNLDINFLKWFAMHYVGCREEYGRKVDDNLFDPEMEIQRISRLVKGLNEISL